MSAPSTAGGGRAAAAAAAKAQLLAAAAATEALLRARFPAAFKPWDGRRKRAAALAALGGLAAWAAYRAYHSRRLAATHDYVKRVGGALSAFAGAGAEALELAGDVARDVRAYAASDGDELPRSVRQLAKLAASPEVAAALRAAAAAAADGALEGAAARLPPGLLGDAAERALGALCSERGRSLVGLAVSVAARQSTTAAMDHLRRSGQADAEAAAAASPGGAAGLQSSLAQLLEALNSQQGAPPRRLFLPGRPGAPALGTRSPTLLIRWLVR